MKIKYLYLLGIFISSITLASKWTYDGISDGELMILYKTLPPAAINISEVEEMVVNKNIGTFRYTDTNKSKEPLEVDINITFDPNVVTNGENDLNKQIINTIYNQVELRMVNDGKFFLNKFESGKNQNKKQNIEQKEGIIDGHAFFVNKSKVYIGTKIIRKINNTIKNGNLTIDGEPIFIDAEFNRDRKQLLSGNYKGTVTLEVEFKGTGGIGKR